MKNSSGTNFNSRQAGRAAADSRDEVSSEIKIRCTGEADLIPSSDGRLTVSVPIKIRRRGGRKQVTLPDGETAEPWERTPTAIQQALARGHRWLAMLESGEVSSLGEIARRENVDGSYVSRMVNRKRHPTTPYPQD